MLKFSKKKESHGHSAKGVSVFQVLVRMSYASPQYEHFATHTETFSGLVARVIQHEYDHIEGILFTDHLSSFKKQLLKNKLNNISNGKVKVGYKMRFFETNKKRTR